ncbi:hypothetical protein FF38_13840 [Lucilia cuprina]|uniref:Uncharacterized protein n=1 Tax=Lucilia cuprina TaxID=7375 RepID=A0A0L0C4J6_LUCCU|nr:hypothetical protein FF38_13840 [Lucilia cuprina]
MLCLAVHNNSPPDDVVVPLRGNNDTELPLPTVSLAIRAYYMLEAKTQERGGAMVEVTFKKNVSGIKYVHFELFYINTQSRQRTCILSTVQSTADAMELEKRNDNIDLCLETLRLSDIITVIVGVDITWNEAIRIMDNDDDEDAVDVDADDEDDSTCCSSMTTRFIFQYRLIRMWFKPKIAGRDSWLKDCCAIAYKYPMDENYNGVVLLSNQRMRESMPAITKCGNNVQGNSGSCVANSEVEIQPVAVRNLQLVLSLGPNILQRLDMKRLPMKLFLLAARAGHSQKR